MIGFYIFMFICTLLIPASMLFFGYRWQKHAPYKVNYLYGYRTARSMSSKQAWNFAHMFLAKLWVRAGWIIGVFSVVLMAALAFVSLEVDLVGTVGGIIVVIQLIPAIVPIFITERELKNKFGL